MKMNFNRIKIGCLSAATICLLAACSSDDSKHPRISEEQLAPKPPAFLIGPASVLLTNGKAFSAKLTMDFPGETNRAHGLSGQLLGQGSHLVFAPTRNDRTFLWDTASHSGWVLSEALQGYAPISSSVHVTNSMTTSETAGPSSQHVNGHPGHEVEVTLSSDDGSTANFTIWRAADLNGYPVRVQSLTATRPYVLNITDISPATLNSNLFSPPESFTKYSSPESMGSELMTRRAKPKKSDTPSLDEVLQKRPDTGRRY